MSRGRARRSGCGRDSHAAVVPFSRRPPKIQDAPPKPEPPKEKTPAGPTKADVEKMTAMLKAKVAAGEITPEQAAARLEALRKQVEVPTGR